MDLKETRREVMNWIRLAYGHGNEHLNSVKGVDFLDLHFSYLQL
jgi:hypothetical protein